MMGNKSRSCAACLQMQETLSSNAMQKPATMTCAHGLSETAVPVRLGNQTIGFLQTGQVMRQKPTSSQFERIARQLQDWGVSDQRQSMKEAFLQTPVVSQKKLDSTMHLLAIFADHLSLMSNQIAVAGANSEPPAVTKA